MGTKRVNWLSTNAVVAGYKSTDYKTLTTTHSKQNLDDNPLQTTDKHIVIPRRNDKSNSINWFCISFCQDGYHIFIASFQLTSHLLH